MSSQAFSWACRQTGMRPGAKLLLAMIANHADKSGVGFPGRRTLAEECCYRPASVTENMALLIKGGWLARIERRRANGSKTSDWLVLAPTSTDRGEMTDADPAEYPTAVAESAQKGSGSVTEPKGSGSVSAPGQVRFPGGPETSVEPTTSLTTTETKEEPGTDLVLLDAPWSRTQARAEGQKNGVEIMHNGQRVPATLLQDAAHAVEYFGQATGQVLRPFTASGKKTEALSRVLTAMRDFPEVRTIYRRMIDAAVRDPWWDGLPGTGVVFGPGKVQEYIQLAEGRQPMVSMRGLTPSGRAIARLMAP